MVVIAGKVFDAILGFFVEKAGGYMLALFKLPLTMQKIADEKTGENKRLCPVCKKKMTFVRSEPRMTLSLNEYSELDHKFKSKPMKGEHYLFYKCDRSACSFNEELPIHFSSL